MTDGFSTESIKQAQTVAYEAVNQLKTETTAIVEYQSAGHLLLIGDAQAVEKFGEIPKELSSEVVSVKDQAPNNDEITIDGALGKFVIKIAEKSINADLVLDLTANPILSMALKPPGYFAMDLSRADMADTSDTAKLIALKQELSNLVGTFEKPRYFDYNASACAHGRSGKTGCTRCLEACPAEAISSLIDSIKVDPTRCQGGGICATVCPSGAISYAYPKAKDLLNHVRTLLLSYLKQGASQPDLVFVTEKEQEQAKQILPAALLVIVEEVASVGPEVWLSALAWGAKAVRLFDLGDGEGHQRMPHSSRDALDHNIEMVQAVLIAANYPASTVAVIANLGDLLTLDSMSKITPASHAALSDKRQAFYMALDYLVEQSDQVKEITLLPEGSIFGDVQVDQEKCTLCMACVSACPANALQDSNETPQLGFVEANCLQCNLCTHTCPESAITISPRLLLNHNARKKPRVLHQDSPFCCISCGEPFATTSGITTIIAKLAGHSMFADERSKNRLKMCDDCRVKDMMEDPNANFNP